MQRFYEIAWVGLLILLMLGWACHFDHLPPENHTATDMYVLKRPILRFARAHNRLPERLSDLPPAEDFGNRLTDVWGKEIQYAVNGATITMTSYGKDQRPGGTGDDLDVIGVFEARTEDGEWKGEANTDNNSDWKVIPLSNRKSASGSPKQST